MKQFRTLLKFALIYFLLSLAGGRMSAQDKGMPLTGHAADLHQKAKDGHFYQGKPACPEEHNSAASRK